MMPTCQYRLIFVTNCCPCLCLLPCLRHRMNSELCIGHSSMDITLMCHQVSHIEPTAWFVACWYLLSDLQVVRMDMFAYITLTLIIMRLASSEETAEGCNFLCKAADFASSQRFDQHRSSTRALWQSLPTQNAEQRIIIPRVLRHEGLKR